MFNFLADHFGKIVDFLREPTGWVLLIGGALLGFGWYQAVHHSEIRELQLKEERLGRPSEELSYLQLHLLHEIWLIQKSTKENKVVVGKDGEVVSDEKHGPLGVNLIQRLYSESPEQHQEDFENLLLSVPSQYLTIIPETRWASPFVLKVTEEGKKKLRV